MKDEHELQHIPSPASNISVRGDTSTGLVARGRREAAKLVVESTRTVLKAAPLQKQGEGEIDEAEIELIRGVLYYHGQGVPQDFEIAAMWFRKAADKGVAAAQYYLGLQYDNGQGVTQSYVQAAVWYQMAAKQGYAQAQNNFGLLYELGDGVPKNFSLATKWFRKAADQGLPSAQAWIGENYYYGRGVSKDYIEAYFWFYLATMDGARDSQEKYSVGRDAAASKLTESQQSDVQERARCWAAIRPTQAPTTHTALPNRKKISHEQRV